MTTKTFRSDDPAILDKLKSFIGTYNRLKEYGIDNEELLDGILDGFIQSFPDLEIVPPAPSVPQFNSIPLPPAPSDIRRPESRRILGHVILNKTTGAISGHFHGQIFLSHLKADTVLTEWLINQQNIPMFNVGSAKKNYEIVPVSAVPSF